MVVQLPVDGDVDGVEDGDDVRRCHRHGQEGEVRDVREQDGDGLEVLGVHSFLGLGDSEEKSII